MPVTNDDLQNFGSFAEQRVSNGGADSIEQLAREWAEAREMAQLADDIAQSEDDIEAGRLHPAAEVIAEVRQKLGLPE